jgi:tRNA (mo5U34)-methyltransferase
MSYRQLQSLLGDGALRGLAQFGTEDWFNSHNNGDLARWRRSLEALPALTPGSVELQQAVRIGDAADCSSAEQSALRLALQGLIPWRKGPFELFGIHIDTEWRSDWKWDRLRQHIAPLRGRTILDVGCGNGYHCFRMAGEGARLAVGVDSQLAYAMQFRMIKQYVPDAPAFVLPVTLESALEQLPAEPAAFDTVFCMGVLYHRRSPIDHLLQLKSCLRPGGELVLETLIVEGPEGFALTPHDRYSRMANVWFIPSCATLVNWLQRCGFQNARVVDVSTTSLEEQRTTDWMRFQSLADSLDPTDRTLTVEGLPAPRRAVLLANTP